jgi:alpha-1,3-rhamnosyl/mannosyltransferase
VHLYNGAAVVAMPSLWEGFGLPALEAMACGKSVIAGARGALPEVVGETGLLVDVEQPSRLQSGLEQLLADDASRARLGQAARERASTFSWERTAAAVAAALNALVTPRSAR